jgi:hypothetical protein
VTSSCCRQVVLSTLRSAKQTGNEAIDAQDFG